MSGSTRGVTIHIDDREVQQLEVDLTEAPKRLQLNARKATKRSADLIEFRMKADARGHRYLPRFPRGISSDLLDSFTADIGFGYTKGLQGALVWIILNGSINNAPVYDWTWAYRRSYSEIEDFYGIAGEESVLGTREA